MPAALLASGVVKCWGRNNYGQLGDGTTTGRFAPVPVGGLTGTVLAVDAGARHTCAIIDRMGTNVVSCWGDNSDSQLGSGGAYSYRGTPVDVVGLSGRPVALALGDPYSCALLDNHTVSCWGWYRGGGEFSPPSSADQSTQAGGPALVSGWENVVALAAGPNSFCASFSDGLKCPGNPGSSGQAVSGIATAPLSVAVGNGQTCAVTPTGSGSTTGGVVCWGRNATGQLGDGTKNDSRDARQRQRVIWRRHSRQRRNGLLLHAARQRRGKMLGNRLLGPVGRWGDPPVYAAHYGAWAQSRHLRRRPGPGGLLLPVPERSMVTCSVGAIISMACLATARPHPVSSPPPLRRTRSAPSLAPSTTFAHWFPGISPTVGETTLPARWETAPTATAS